MRNLLHECLESVIISPAIMKDEKKQVNKSKNDQKLKKKLCQIREVDKRIKKKQFVHKGI